MRCRLHPDGLVRGVGGSGIDWEEGADKDDFRERDDWRGMAGVKEEELLQDGLRRSRRATQKVGSPLPTPTA